MGRKPADLWRYADRMDKRFKCKFCKQIFPGGIVRLRSHLSGIKGQGIQICTKALKDAQDAALLAASNKKLKHETSSSNSDGTSSVIFDANCSHEVDNLLAKFLEMNDIPSSIVELPSFINLVNKLVKSCPGDYVIPSGSTLENHLIPSIRQEVEQYFLTSKQSWEDTGCTVITDIWSYDKEKRSFISVVACAKKMAVLVNTFEIPNNNVTADFLEAVAHSVVKNIGVEFIVQFIVDDTPFSEVFSEFLARKCPRLCITRSANRELRSFFDEVEKEVEWVLTTFETAKSLVDSIYNDGELLRLMRKFNAGKELEQSSFGYGTLESILECKEELLKLVQSPEWLGKQESAKEATEVIANPEFWKQGKEIQMILNPLSKILQLDDAFDSGFGYLYGLVKLAAEAIASLHTKNPVKYQKLLDIFESKKGKIVNQTHKVAAFLNPAYMCSEIVQESETEGAIDYMLEKLVSFADEVALVKDAIHYRRTLSNPSHRFKIIAAKTSSPCEWWSEFGSEFPVLKKYAIRILSQRCGSSSLESDLSAFRSNQIKHRGLVPDLNALNLRLNHFLMDKFSADNASQNKIIAFEEFGQHKAIDRGCDEVFAEARHSDEDTRHLTVRGEFPGSNRMKLCFGTTIASPIVIGQKVEGEQAHSIHVYLVDSTTNCVVEEGLPSMLNLSVSVLDGDFSTEGSSSSDGFWTREQFDINDLSSTMAPLVTGDLQVMLVQGAGILGNFSFNYSSRGTRSGKFRLAVKTDTGNCEGIRTLEGISNAFIVEDNEVTRNQHLAACDFNLPKDSDSFNIFEPMEMLSDDSGSPGLWNGHILWNNEFQWSSKSLTQTAARRVKKKAMSWRLKSRITKRRSHQTLEQKRELSTTLGLSLKKHQKKKNKIADEAVITGPLPMVWRQTLQLWRLKSHRTKRRSQKALGEETRETTTMKLSLTENNEVLQPKKTLQLINSDLKSGSASSGSKPQQPAITLFGVQVTTDGTKYICNNTREDDESAREIEDNGCFINYAVNNNTSTAEEGSSKVNQSIEKNKLFLNPEEEKQNAYQDSLLQIKSIFEARKKKAPCRLYSENQMEPLSATLNAEFADLTREFVRNEIHHAYFGSPKPPLKRLTLNPETVIGTQLRFGGTLPQTIFTGNRILCEDGTPLKFEMVDIMTKKPVTSGPFSSFKIEVFALNGDFGTDKSKDWTEKDFNGNIVRERQGRRPLLSGERCITLEGGIGYLGDITFTDNSSWLRSRKFQLGARCLNQASDGLRIKECLSDTFIVKDHRASGYMKHNPPHLDDEVWRLNKIAKDGCHHSRLSSSGINTVKEFLQHYETDPSFLKNIFGPWFLNGTWEAIVKHASTCVVDDNKLFGYQQEETGLLFNSVYKVVGAMFDGHNYLPLHNLTSSQTILLEDMKKHAHSNLHKLFPIAAHSRFFSNDGAEYEIHQDLLQPLEILSINDLDMEIMNLCR